MKITDKTTITIKTDRSMKKDFADLCDSIGISMSAVLNAMIRQAVRKQEIKFSALDLNGLKPSEASELKRRVDEVKAGRTKLYSLIES
ncbi:MAG: type II toxin-antitoxin system RelB/DinJ family antitoxin [Synergistaceae bacterium]|nr:type II toxin-antitoxin system RelB/DinJ family antitoxin [Synergistaceae bacterium]